MAADEELQLYLPKHNRCGAHTVNLMATYDVSEVIFSTLIVNPDPILFPVLRIRDVYLGFRILIFTHPGSLDFFPPDIPYVNAGFNSKSGSYLISCVADPGCLSRIPDPDFHSSRITGLFPPNIPNVNACFNCLDIKISQLSYSSADPDQKQCFGSRKIIFSDPDPGSYFSFALHQDPFYF